MCNVETNIEDCMFDGLDCCGFYYEYDDGDYDYDDYDIDLITALCTDGKFNQGTLKHRWDILF